MFHLPITLLTTGVCGIILVVLSARIVSMRVTHTDLALGDGGNKTMLIRIRSQANFIEYVPITLILMALIEGAGGSSVALKIAGETLILCRIFHAIGMPMKSPNFFRAAGAAGTFILIIALSLYAIVIVMGS